MAWYAASQMWRGVFKSGSPRLKSNTVFPPALSCRAFAPAANVAEGCTAAPLFEIRNMRLLPGSGLGVVGILSKRASEAHVGQTTPPSPGMRYSESPGCGTDPGDSEYLIPGLGDFLSSPYPPTGFSCLSLHDLRS